jgi:hypothetical protein
MSGSGKSVWRVKTDWNCCSRIFALEALSLNRVVPFFRGAMPALSCHLDFTYRPKGLEFFSFRPSSMVVLMYCHSARLR